jgi:Nif-specific regulatory protein
MAAAADRLRAERDLYRELLALGAVEDLRGFVAEALRRAMAIADARQGYLAVTGADGRPKVQLAEACDPDQVRGVLSGTIVREALASGRTVRTASAVSDPRFAGGRSVVAQKLTAVLCAPIAPAGVLCLQGRDEPGAFTDDDQRLVEDFARALGPWLERLATAEVAPDPTLPWRERLGGLDAVVGRSPALARVLEQVALAAPLDITVLLTGPSGSGKTLLAQSLHGASRRRSGPFIELNCAALPEHLVESELFGAEKGAHSAADRARPGKVEAAEGGTLFLDELGELSPGAQARLLQFLQSRTYFRLGSTRARVGDVRVIAATNVDLPAAVAAKRFREDLYWRLNVLAIRVPGLADRPEDIVPVAEALALTTAARHRLGVARLSPGALAALRAAEWPGNVRQLANVVEAGVVRAAMAGGGAVEAAHLFPGANPDATGTTLQEATRGFQRRIVADTLTDTSWNVSEAARRLDVARSHLNELIRAFELRRPGS